MGEIARLEGWEERLAALLESSAHRPFCWGTHDCATFAADGVQALTGRDVSAPFRGLYADRQEARQLLYEWGADLAGMATQECERLGFERTATALACRGDPALLTSPMMGYALGIVDLTGRQVAQPGETGLVMQPLRSAMLCWRVC